MVEISNKTNINPNKSETCTNDKKNDILNENKANELNKKNAENQENNEENSTDKEKDKEQGEDNGQVEETEPQAYFEPVVKLDAVEVVSGEENEEILFKMRGKLFTFRETMLDKGTGNKTWCERGIGDIRFLKHRELGKIRILMRQEKTLKIICNHLVDPRTELMSNMGSDRAWVWNAYDYSEGELISETFAIRFGTSENAKKFKEQHDQAKLNNKKIEEGKDADDTTAGNEAADVLKNLKVDKK